MVSMLASSAVDCVFELRSGQTKHMICYRIGLCCLSVKHAALRRNSRDCWLGIRIICQSGETCLLTDCCFSELALK
jgi:hypothetical protein